MTVPAIVARNVAVDPNDPNPCWIWTAYCDAHIPRMRVGDNRTSISARRYVYELCKGPLRKNYFPVVTCEEKRCINPDHCKVTTRGGYIRMAIKRGVHYGHGCSPAFMAARHARSKLNWEQVREIRRRTLNDESDPVIAADYNVDKTTIARIRRNEIWVEATSLGALVKQLRRSAA